MSTLKHKKSTYERIIDESLLLFNEQGERAISTNHIAAHLNMSPGNLYYHFRNKDEIIVQIFQRYRLAILGFLDQEAAPETPEKVAQFMRAIVGIMWDYRFFFVDLTTLLTRSEELTGRHHEFTRQDVAPRLFQHFTHLNEIGLTQMDNQAIVDLIGNIWLLGKFWFVHERSMHEYADNDPADNEMVQRRAVYQMLSLVRPHVTPAHQAEFLSVMNAYARASEPAAAPQFA